MRHSTVVLLWFDVLNVLIICRVHDHRCFNHTGAVSECLMDDIRGEYLAISLKSRIGSIALFVFIGCDPVDSNLLLIIVNFAQSFPIFSLKLLPNQRVLPHLVIRIVVIEVFG